MGVTTCVLSMKSDDPLYWCSCVNTRAFPHSQSRPSHILPLGFFAPHIPTNPVTCSGKLPSHLACYDQGALLANHHSPLPVAGYTRIAVACIYLTTHYYAYLT
jgi:hypothetical protein